MKAALAQFGASADPQTNLRYIENFAQQAARAGADMLLCPEFSMFYAGAGCAAQIRQAAEPLDGPFTAALGGIARKYGLWIAAGMYEKTPDGLPYNTVIVLDHTGALRGMHRKNRLYDAFGYRESDECRAGEAPFSPVDTPLGRLGIITCFELRFPALAAAQKAAQADVLFVPAGWVCGPNKLLHWQTLLRARAIENSMTVLGCGQYAENLFIGHSAAFAPDGTMLGALQAGDGLLMITI